MGQWSFLSSLASFDIASIDQQYRRVANALTRIPNATNKLESVSPQLWEPIYILRMD